MRCDKCKVMLDATTGRKIDYEQDAIFCLPCYDEEHGITENLITGAGINKLYHINTGRIHPLFGKILNTTLGGRAQ